MKIRFVYGILPAFIFYPKLKKLWASAASRGPFVRIFEFQDEEGVLQHELIHVRQWYRTLGMQPFIYMLSRRHRQKSEVEAFQKQLEFIPHPENIEVLNIDTYARLLAYEYNLNLTAREAKNLLLEEPVQ